MQSSLFIHKITVVRRTVSSVNALGETIYTTSNVYTSQPARIENFSSKSQYNDPGERDFDQTIVYVPSNITIQLQDQIIQTSPTTITIGLVRGINVAIKGTTTAVDHYELVIEPS